MNVNEMRVYLWDCWSLIYIYGKRFMVDGRTDGHPRQILMNFAPNYRIFILYNDKDQGIPCNNSNALGPSNYEIN